jgi:hypothetical protein
MKRLFKSLLVFLLVLSWILTGWLVGGIKKVNAAIARVTATPAGVVHTTAGTTCANTATAGFGTSTGQTIVVVVSLQKGATYNVTGVADNAAGGSNTYSGPINVDNTNGGHDSIWWSTNISKVNASGLVVTATMPSQRHSCAFKAYTGVISAAAAITSSNTGGSNTTGTITTVTSSPNSWIISGLSALNGSTTVTQNGGTLDASAASTGSTTPSTGLVSQTTANQGGSITNSVTWGAARYWAVSALELRSDLINPTVSPNGGSFNNDTSTTLQGSDAGVTYCYTSGNGTQAAPTATTPGTCATGTAYSGAFNITATGTVLKVLATKSGWTNSAVTTSSAFTLTVANPAFGTNGGSFLNDTTSTQTSTTTGAVFCQTVDGTTSPAASTPGTCSVGTTGASATVIATGKTIKVLGTKANYVNSAVQTSSAFTLTVGAITSSPGAGTYSSIPQSVTLNIATTTGANAYYTTNGSAVSCASTLYSGAFNVSATTTIKAIGCKTNYVNNTAISDLYTIISPPTVTTQAVTGIAATTAVANGNLTVTGGANATKEGFVYDTSTKTPPGNVAPASSGYASFTENTGSYGTGTFTVNLSGLTSGVTYYGRAYAQNSAGWGYGDEVIFTPYTVSISLTTDGSVPFGIVTLGGIKHSGPAGMNHPETISVDGGPAALRIKSTNFTEGANTWTLSGGSGANLVKWEFSKDGSAWTTFSSPDPTDYSFDTPVDQGQTRNVYLKITMPTSTASYNQYSSSVTMVASYP